MVLAESLLLPCYSWPVEDTHANIMVYITGMLYCKTKQAEFAQQVSHATTWIG